MDLESEGIYIIREAYKKFPKLAMGWSIGKDSTVMLWLTRKAFLGRVPFPVFHVDTKFKFPEMIAYRDRVAREWGFPLITYQNDLALDAGMNHTRGKIECCTALKTEGLRQLLEKERYQAIFFAVRRDEDPVRAKERFFSPRSAEFEWDFKDQPPEFWDQFQTDFPAGTHVRVHPLLNWTELDIWRYIRKEKIPVIDLYFSKNGKRYRSIGCHPCTGSVDSNAQNVDEIIAELETTELSERSGRAQDRADDFAMQKLRAKGYM